MEKQGLHSGERTRLHLMWLGFKSHQGAKKVVSDSPGLVDFAVGPVIFCS